MSFRSTVWTMRRILEGLANSFGDREMVVFPDADPEVRWSAAEFDRELDRVAGGYADLGLGPGDRLALIGLNTPAFVTAWYGAVKAGVVPCNFNPRESGDRLATLGGRYDADALVYDPRFGGKAGHVTREASPDVRIALPGEADDDAPTPTHDVGEVRADAPPDVTVERDDVAFVNWSTGTTGVPKGLVWEHEGAVAAGLINAVAREVTHQDVRINYGTPGFIGWFYSAYPALTAGATVVYMESYDPERYLELIDREGATEFGGVSTPVRMALDAIEAEPDRYDLSSVEAAHYVGETMKRETIERVRALVTPNMTSLYGTTEATGLTAMNSGSDDPTALSDHIPLVEARAVELGEDGEQAPPDAIVPTGERGELILRTPGRAERVLDDPERTARIFRDGWWYSGDVVRRNEDGTYRIVGRSDDMIISGGINVFPSLVEDVLAAHPAVENVAVIGLEDEQWGQRVAAAVQFADGAEADVDALEAHCLEDTSLPRHARPREYYVFAADEEFPKTPTGKIFRAELEELLAEREGVRPGE